MRYFPLCALVSLCLMVSAEDSVQRGEPLSADAFYKLHLPNLNRPDPTAGLSSNAPEVLKRPDPTAGLSSNAPEVLKREAAKYALKADTIRFFIERNHIGGPRRLVNFDDNMLQLAVRAVKFPTQCENMRLVPKWAEWIKQYQKPLHYDTRSDSDRFFAFMLDRNEHKGNIAEYTVDLEDIFGKVYEVCWEESWSRCMSATSSGSLEESHAATDIRSALVCLHDPDYLATACWPYTTTQTESQGHATPSCVPLVIAAGLNSWQPDITTVHLGN